MIRIKYILLCLLFLSTVHIYGQSLLVYHVVGKVTYTVKGASKPLVLNTSVSASTNINVPYGGKVELLNEKSNQRITIKNPGNGTIEQLSKSNGNSVSELSQKYVAYVKKQLTNKGLVSQQRYTDFATVTREKETFDPAKNNSNTSLADRFNNFKNKTEKKFLSFRQECNNKYIEFVKNAWEKMGAEPAVERPNEPEVTPVVLDDTIATSRFLFFGRKKKSAKVEDVQLPLKQSQPQPIDTIKEVKMTKEEQEFCSMPFIFFGSEMSVRLDETKRVNIGKINPERVADVLKYFSSSTFDNLLFDCLKLRKEHKLCDWAYLLMLKEITDQFCGADTNEATLLLGYLYLQSGYKVRFGYDDANHLFLLLASDYMIYGKPVFRIDGQKFYALQEVGDELYICDAKFPKEQNLSLTIDTAMQLDETEMESRTITSKAYPEISVNVTSNRCLIDFYNTYPTSYINGNQYTRWALYADTPLDEDVKNQIYPVLRKHIEGMSELDAVNRLLNWVQTGLEYGYDTEIWGGDRAFFAEETLYYPFCDCEDRSILFTRLVRDLLGLKCVLLYYPGHLASAVHFTNTVEGNYYTMDGTDYTVCDATYIGAPVGMEMEDMSEKGAILIPIQ